MKRKLYDELKKWKNNGKGVPLILLGSRFVGKTKLVREFGKKEFKEVVYINFEEMSEINELFDGSLSIEELLVKTSQLLGFFEISTNDTLFVLEEIQSCPNIVPLIKFVYEKIPPFYLLITSSNPGYLSNIDTSLFMDKINILEVSPLSFTEFLNYTEQQLYKKYKEITMTNNLDKVLHNQLILELQHYLIIGGMPESLLTWKNTKIFHKVEQEQINIINKIKNDFVRYGSKFSSEKLFNIFDNVPIQLNNESKKFLYSKLKDGARAREYKKCIDWLTASHIIKNLKQIESLETPLEKFSNEKNFRLYLNDVGLLKTMMKLNNDDIFLNKDFLHKKSLIENFVYLQLKQIFNEKIYFFSFNRFDLDFLVEYKNIIIPIDVKTSNIKHKNSLSNYIRKFKPKISIRYSFNYLKYEKNILNIPFYLIDKTFEFVDYILEKDDLFSS